MSFEKISALTDRIADTFMFSEEDRRKILSNAEGAGLTWDNTKCDNKAGCTKQLEQLLKRDLTLSLHASTLKTQRIPRGLRSNVMPILLKDDKEYREKWFALSNRYSLDLMYLTVQHLQMAIQNVKQDIEKTDKELKEQITINDYSKIQEELKINIEKLKEQIMKNKLQKFERDTKDYMHDKVYTWAEDRRKYRRTQNQEGRNTQSDTTDQGSDTQKGGTTNRKTAYKKYSKQNPFFLGRREETLSSESEPGGVNEQNVQTRSKTMKKTA